MILYLDFDGVLHRYLVNEASPDRRVLRGMGPLFEFAPVLVDLQAPHPALRIVLATDWVEFPGFRGHFWRRWRNRWR